MNPTRNESSSSLASGNALSTLSALFDDRGEAESAIKRLKEIGLPDDRIRFMPGDEAGDARRPEPGGWFAGLENWLFPDEDRASYAEGLRRGGYLVSVQVDDATYEAAHHILDNEGSIDMDQRADLWRSEGWDGGGSDVTLSEDALVAPPGTDPRTTDFAVNAARNSRDLEKSTPRVRLYRHQMKEKSDRSA
ncbi:hypothetical protein [Rhizobium mesoamericanum]|uniref:Uncharacterized protein n=1 Tax=Rhizobium mesoamericanum STM3625 TaxID=1211777 RepID=K0PQ77_9HYPH|nr:hypothetical protein [Rhizobium mesoamericanum]CCM75998.1 conserved hypothetical protein [Rhizobium mesoamericanum STM3625]